jgi:hypothetical protein
VRRFAASAGPKASRYVGIHVARAWPAHEGREAAIARAKIADLSCDDRLANLLALEVSHYAARWWSSRMIACSQ